ncbi:MAG: hypothetical protein CSA81_14825 [Acidobacteria bacterium]|nr:MAG: hypothetical protein CSA81_14825 [Acidobacteriota bacterium]
MDSKKLDESHTRLDSTTEIIRFQIADWLREMDDPKDVLYRLENMKKVEIKGKRVYRVHMIMSLKKTRDPASEKLYHYCITLNKSGIIRVEKV